MCNAKMWKQQHIHFAINCINIIYCMKAMQKEISQQQKEEEKSFS